MCFVFCLNLMSTISNTELWPYSERFFCSLLFVWLCLVYTALSSVIARHRVFVEKLDCSTFQTLNYSTCDCTNVQTVFSAKSCVCVCVNNIPCDAIYVQITDQSWSLLIMLWNKTAKYCSQSFVVNSFYTNLHSATYFCKEL